MMINVIVIGIAFTVVVKDKWLCVDMGAIITANMVLKMQKGAFARWHCLFKEIRAQIFFFFYFSRVRKPTARKFGCYSLFGVVND